MIGIVAHDAGGAEIVSSYLRRNNLKFVCCLDGPARQIFARKFGNVEGADLASTVAACDWLLCGTSFLSDIEWQALGMARQAGKPSVSAIDHWVNYRQRFFRHGEWRFPDELWVGDEVGLRLARTELPEVAVKLVPNPYFSDLRDELMEIAVPPRAARDGVHILYASTPTREDGLAFFGNERHWGYTEEEALRYFLSNAGSLASRIGRIVVRPHPKEGRDKYAWAKSEFDLPIVTDEDKTLLQQVAASDVVAGCATMAMVVGLIAGKRVVSCIPPGGKTAPLPYPEIEDMRQLTSAPAASIEKRRNGL
jgi:hypothetical protein